MALSVKTGSYTGNGSDPQTITGVGFTPKVLIIFGHAGTGDGSAACWKTTDMATGASGRTSNMGENGNQTDGLIDELISDGFKVRGLKNTNAVTYYYLALAGTDVVTGTYTGNGIDNRNITGVGFTSEWVVIQGGTYHSFHKSQATGASTDICQYFSVVDNVSDAIQSIGSDGFQVGAGTMRTNVNAVAYYYFCVKQGSYIKSGSFDGDGSDDKDIAGVGFAPICVMTKSAKNYQSVWRGSHSGDLSSYTRAATPAANLIQSFSASGFQVGSASEVNYSGYKVYYVAFAQPSTTTTSHLLSSTGVGS